MKNGCGSEPATKRVIELPVLPTAAPQGVRHSRTSWWRAAALITLNLLMIAHFIQWKITGSTVSPIEPSESMQTLQQGAINAGFVFFVLAIIATLVLGRFVCGWGCHVLALQDLCAWLLNKIGLKPRPFRSRLLMFVPLLAALYMFVWPTVLRAMTKPKDAPLFPGFTNHLITTDFWATFPPFWVAVPFLFICGFVTVYFLGQKGFCTYACPYGGFFAVADKVAPGRIRVTDACNECGHCTAVCTSNVIVHAEVKEHKMVVDPGCMKCMDCVSVCPTDALYFGFGKPAISVKKPAPKSFQLSWPEEIFAAAVFFLSLFAVWDVYQLVPMLMALGTASVTAFIAYRALKLVRSRDLAFYKWSLRTQGRLTFAGILFLVFSAAWLGVIAHSGLVRYNERNGARAFESLQIPDELALAKRDPSEWLSPSDQANIASGRAAFDAATKSALFTNVEAIPKRAWLEYLAGNTDRALSLLARSEELQSGQAKALSLYYRGAVLNRQGRFHEAQSELEEAISLRPDLASAREELGVALWKLDRKNDAINAWSDALKANPRLPIASNFLAGAAAESGRPEAAAIEKQADQLVPLDARFHWLLGLRLKDLGMTPLSEKRFDAAVKIDPRFRSKARD